ncbi:probable LRR receptor-like serine threonine-kinase At3g47570 [Olea europaea subsp. europaea]|uniref:non-specific serine/threonine protein kinase n=1 Tax=Olea europaea subsp. europaea TaxID=158383 RepID=A0A8S0U271_OLEEU|nr:probable LRR receptor-like serine threonine-kinase At3g47570 [Olea europaea subsp. europaea]
MDFSYFTMILLVMLILIATYSDLQLVASLSITTDKEALISFKSQINLESPDSPLSTWDENLSPCNWTGVFCNKQSQRVIRVDLSNLRMTGSISPHVGNLSFLTTLQLQNNQLKGKIPDEFGNLPRLRFLNLSFNSLEDVVPRNISQCKQLRVLDLMQNQISGQIPEEISYLKQLQVLNLARNELSGSIPPSLANISSLNDLNLGTNKLGNSIPSDLSLLRNLKFLDLTINNLTGSVPPSIYNMSSLVYLALASNDLSGDLPGDVGLTLPNLLGFNFCFNKFTGTIPWSLHNLTNIEVIRMAHNLLHGTIPPGLGNLPDLRFYNIGFNRIVSSGKEGLNFLELLSNSTRLDFLAIDFNLFEGVIPNSIGSLSKVLTKFYMGGNNIYGTIPPSIGELRGLQLLNLSYSSVSGKIPEEIGQLTELQILGLADNNLSGEIPNSLGNLLKLNRIDLSRNELEGSIPTTFGNFQNLISMDLSDNRLNGSIPTVIFKLPKLSAFLNLSQNYLTGPLPVEIGLLENVVTINISDNKISGNISESVGNCKSLEQLLLARNTFSGQIPSTLGEVRGLEILDLSSNQLSGAIPLDLENLMSLQLLNLSFNRLEGKIPVFTNSMKLYLEGNQNLCLDLACKHFHVRRRTVYIIVIPIAIVALCFAVGLLFYIRKGKGMVKGNFESFRGQHQMISYDELRQATENFKEENLIGQGSFGSVYRGLIQGGIAVAIKVLDTTMAKSQKIFLAECAALRCIRHRNLVKLITVCSSIDYKNDGFLALVFEFMSNGNLDDWIRGKRRYEDGKGLNAMDRLNLAIGVASAVEYLHNETGIPIVHCDLKPSNILLDSDMTPKVGDFGLAKLLIERNDNQTAISSTYTLKGTIGYIPPEYGFGEKPSVAGDVYSYGILLLELFTGKSPTDQSFTGGLSLKNWVEKFFPTYLAQVLDPALLQNGKDIWDESKCTKPEIQDDCLVTIFKIGLSCTVDSPDGRISMRDALGKLKGVKDILQKAEGTEVRMT